MEANAIHDLTAAYALDALDSDEAREYEAHLAHCERCRSELASLSVTATSLAYATESPAPPAELRERILVQARSERANVVPLRPRWVGPVAAVAAVAACAAVALGIWAASLSSKLDASKEKVAAQTRVAAILADPACGGIREDRVRRRTRDARRHAHGRGCAGHEPAGGRSGGEDLRSVGRGRR